MTERQGPADNGGALHAYCRRFPSIVSHLDDAWMLVARLQP